MACCLAALLLFFAPSGLRAQTGVAATVGDQDIRVERLQLQVELVLARTPAEGQKLEIIKAQVLEEGPGIRDKPVPLENRNPSGRLDRNDYSELTAA